MGRKNLILILFLFSLLMRTVYIMEQKKSPLFTCPIIDAAYNFDLAKAVLSDSSKIPEVFFRPPLYPFFLAFLLRISGGNLFTVRFFQAIIGSISVVFVFLIAERVFSKKAGIMAGVMASFFWTLIYFTSEFLDTTLFIFLVLIGTYFIILFQEGFTSELRDSSLKIAKYYVYRKVRIFPPEGPNFSAGRSEFFRIIIAGISFGAASLARSEGLVFVLLYSIWIMIRGRFVSIKANEDGGANREYSENGKTGKQMSFLLQGRAPSPYHGRKSKGFHRLKHTFIVLLLFNFAVFITIFPATLHNKIKGGDWVLISSYSGVVFYIGNHPDSEGWRASFPGMKKSEWRDSYLFPVKIAKEKTGKSTLKPSEVSGFYFNKALGQIRRTPGKSLLLFIKKALLFFNRTEIPGNLNQNFFSKEFSRLIIPLQFFSFAFILPFSLASLFFIFHERSQKSVPILLWVFSIFMANVVFFTNGRHRVLAIPFFIILAAAGLEKTFNLFKTPKLITRAIFTQNLPLWILILGGLILPLCPFPDSSEFLAESYFKLGFASAKKGDLEDAEKYYLRALEINPGYLRAKRNLGNVYRLRNQRNRAERCWEEILIRNPDYAGVNESLGNLMMEEGNWERAKDYFRREIQISPGSPILWFKLADTLRRGGKNEEALKALKEALLLDPENVPARKLFSILTEKGYK